MRHATFLLCETKLFYLKLCHRKKSLSSENKRIKFSMLFEIPVQSYQDILLLGRSGSYY